MKGLALACILAFFIPAGDSDVDVKPRGKKRTKDIIKIYRTSYFLFFNYHTNIDPASCNFKRLRISVLPAVPDSNWHGKYYWRENKMVVTDIIYKHPEYMAHELAHYFYDSCYVFSVAEEYWAERFEEFYRAVDNE